VDNVRTRFWQLPERLTPGRARLSIGLGLAALALALATLAVGESEVPPRLLSAAVLVLTGLGNLSWALGSLLPQEAGGRALREVARLLGLLLLVASIVLLAGILHAAVVYREGVFLLIPAVAAGLAVFLAGRLRRQSPNGVH
jgi:hypothetical protein